MIYIGHFNEQSPKNGYIAVMFNTGEIYNWWTHLTIKEFEICFPELKEYTENIKN